MATATRSIPIPTTPPPVEITLTLSEAEARAIFVVLGKVGGSPDCSPRKHTQAAYDALSTALGAPWVLDMPEYKLAEGSIVFRSKA